MLDEDGVAADFLGGREGAGRVEAAGMYRQNCCCALPTTQLVQNPCKLCFAAFRLWDCSGRVPSKGSICIRVSRISKYVSIHFAGEVWEPSMC